MTLANLINKAVSVVTITGAVVFWDFRLIDGTLRCIISVSFISQKTECIKMKIVLAAIMTISLLNATPAAAECKMSDAVKWSLGGAAVGVGVAVIWGAGLIAAPFTGGTSIIGSAAAAGTLSAAVIGKAVVASGATALTLAKVGAASGAAVGAGVTAADCAVDD